MVELTGLDVAVMAAYFVVTLALGFWVGRGERDALDYFLAARNLPWYLIGFSLYASNMSGASFVGLMGAAYQHGMVVFNYEWTATLVLIVFAVFMLPAFLRAKLFTVPEYLEVRFDRRSRWVYACLTILTLIFIDMAGAIYAGGIVMSTMFPGVTLWQASAAMALLAGSYTLFGGLRSVVVTDALQAVLMIVGAALLFFFGLDKVGGWDALMQGLEEAQTRLIQPANDAFLPWPGIAGVVLLGFYYWTLNQYFVQRALAARSLEEGRKGALFGGLLKLPNVFLMILPGMIAVVLLPGMDNPDRVFPTLAAKLLPAGLTGLILTALVAAIMSSLDSALNAAASLLTMDFIRPLKPDISGGKLLVVGRALTAVLIFVAAVYAPLIERFGSLFQYFQATLSYLVPPIVAIYLGGLFWRRMTGAGAFWGMVVGLLSGLVLYLLKEVSGVWAAAGLPPVHFTYMAVLIFLFSFVVMTLVSVAGGMPSAPSRGGAVFERGDLSADPQAKGHKWVYDHRVLAAGLALLMVGAILIFS
jgi:solute:Na+ symporter, SSS family